MPRTLPLNQTTHGQCEGPTASDADSDGPEPSPQGQPTPPPARGNPGLCEMVGVCLDEVLRATSAVHRKSAVEARRRTRPAPPPPARIDASYDLLTAAGAELAHLYLAEAAHARKERLGIPVKRSSPNALLPPHWAVGSPLWSDVVRRLAGQDVSVHMFLRAGLPIKSKSLLIQASCFNRVPSRDTRPIARNRTLTCGFGSVKWFERCTLPSTKLNRGCGCPDQGTFEESPSVVS